MDKNYVVSKSNHFIINSSYDLSIEEQRIILTLASMVQPEDEEFKPYKFKVSEFLKLLGVKDQSKYKSIPILTKELMKKVFEIKKGTKTIQVAWLCGAVHDSQDGSVTLEFSPRLKPYLLELKGYFTNYKLSNILQMKSKYSPRFYELLKMNQYNKKGFEIEVDELRKLFKATDIYPNYADFKKRILKKSQDELKMFTDISFDFKEIKCGRYVKSIKFFIFENNQTENKVLKQVEEIKKNKTKKKPKTSKKTVKEKLVDKVEEDLKNSQEKITQEIKTTEEIIKEFENLDKDMKEVLEEKARELYLEFLNKENPTPKKTLSKTDEKFYNIKKTKNSYIVKAMKIFF